MKKKYLSIIAVLIAAASTLTGCFWEGPLYPEEAAKAAAAAAAAETQTEEATEIESSFFKDREMDCNDLKIGSMVEGKCTGALYYSSGSVSENYEFDEAASSAKLRISNLSSSTVGVYTTYRITVTAELAYVFNQTKSDWYTVTPGVGFTPFFLMDYYTGNVFPTRNTSSGDSYDQDITIDWKEESYDISYSQSIEWGDIELEEDADGVTAEDSSISKYVGTATCQYTIKVPKDYDGLVFAYDLNKDNKDDKSTSDEESTEDTASSTDNSQTGILTTDSEYSLTSLHGIMDGMKDSSELDNYMFWRIK